MPDESPEKFIQKTLPSCLQRLNHKPIRATTTTRRHGHETRFRFLQSIATAPRAQFIRLLKNDAVDGLVQSCKLWCRRAGPVHDSDKKYIQAEPSVPGRTILVFGCRLFIRGGALALIPSRTGVSLRHSAQSAAPRWSAKSAAAGLAFIS